MILSHPGAYATISCSALYLEDPKAPKCLYPWSSYRRAPESSLLGLVSARSQPRTLGELGKEQRKRLKGNLIMSLSLGFY